MKKIEIIKTTIFMVLLAANGLVYLCCAYLAWEHASGFPGASIINPAFQKTAVSTFMPHSTP